MVLQVFGNCVFWRSKVQDTIADSTMHAEIIAMTSAANEMLWMKHLLLDLGFTVAQPVLWGDNKSALFCAECEHLTPKSRHIERKDMYVKDLVQRQYIKTEWCQSSDQLADVMTKVLPGPALTAVRDALQLRLTS